MSDLRRDLHQLIDRIIDAVESAPKDDELVDQKHSPLGRTRHTALAREGKIPATRDGKRVLIKRSDIQAYLDRNKVVRRGAKETRAEAAIRIIAEMERKSA